MTSKEETKMTQAAQQVKLEGVTLMWANLDVVNDMSQKFQVDLTNLSPENVEKIASLGLKVRTRADKPEKGAFITCKSTFPIVAIDRDSAPIKVKVGNGSKANVLLGYYIPKKKPPGGPDRCPTILKLKVTDLVAFENDNSDDDGDL